MSAISCMLFLSAVVGVAVGSAGIEMTAQPPFGDMLAQSYCTSLAPKSDDLFVAMVYAVRKNWTMTCEQTCQSELIASQDPDVKSKGWTGQCHGAIKIYTDFTNTVISREGGEIGLALADPKWVNKLYMKTYRSRSCVNKDGPITDKHVNGQGPNFCCCSFREY